MILLINNRGTREDMIKILDIIKQSIKDGIYKGFGWALIEDEQMIA